MKKVLVIAGPTASGKTAFSLSLAKQYGGYIISGDSVQVYRGMDIGSGKIMPDEMQGIRHELIDILDPDVQYTVSDFQKNARALIGSSNTLPIIVGGTGLYLKACLYDYDFAEEEGGSSDPSLEKYTSEELYAILKREDPLQAEKIHPNNRRRLLRSLTILERTGIPQGEKNASQKHEMLYDVFIAGCTMERSLLHQRIAQRVHMMAEQGLKQEVQALAEKYGFEAPGMQGIGYKEWKAYFAGECTEAEVIEKIIIHSRQYARRQYTWLNHQMPVHWFDITSEEDTERIRKEIGQWIRDCSE